jgi:hypothetical protein
VVWSWNSTCSQTYKNGEKVIPSEHKLEANTTRVIEVMNYVKMESGIGKYLGNKKWGNGWQEVGVIMTKQVVMKGGDKMHERWWNHDETSDDKREGH